MFRVGKMKGHQAIYKIPCNSNKTPMGVVMELEETSKIRLEEVMFNQPLWE